MNNNIINDTQKIFSFSVNFIIIILNINSYELRSPEFPRIPSASRPEYFTIFWFLLNLQ
jgi:hypothetical protein